MIHEDAEILLFICKVHIGPNTPMEKGHLVH